jgi:hypothetical protein
MDIRTSGLLSAAMHNLQMQGDIASSPGSSSISFLSRCQRDLAKLCSDAYMSAVRRKRSGVCSGDLLFAGTTFYRLINNASTEQSSARMASLLYSNLILLECAFDKNAVKSRFARSAALGQLLQETHGSTEAICFALLTVDRGDGSHAMHNTEQCALAARCLYATSRMSEDARQELEMTLIGMLRGEPYEIDMLRMPTELTAMTVKEGFEAAAPCR